MVKSTTRALICARVFLLPCQPRRESSCNHVSSCAAIRNQYPENISNVFARGAPPVQHVHSATVELAYLLHHSMHRVLAMKDVYVCGACMLQVNDIYAPVAVDVLKCIYIINRFFLLWLFVILQLLRMLCHCHYSQSTVIVWTVWLSDIVSELQWKLTSIPWAARLSWLENAYSRPLFWWAILTHKLGQTDLVLLHAIMVH